MTDPRIDAIVESMTVQERIAVILFQKLLNWPAFRRMHAKTVIQPCVQDVEKKLGPVVMESYGRGFIHGKTISEDDAQLN